MEQCSYLCAFDGENWCDLTLDPCTHQGHREKCSYDGRIVAAIETQSKTLAAAATRARKQEREELAG